MSDVKLNCPHCDQSLEAPEELLGQTVPCPSCQRAIELKKPVPPSAILAVAPPAVPVPATKACPFCFEQILAAARKCKHCGEFLDAKTEPSTSTKPTPVHVQVSAPVGPKLARCPKCGCESISGAKQGFSGNRSGCFTLLFGWNIGLLSGLFGMNRMYSHCLQCGYKWELVEKAYSSPQSPRPTPQAQLTAWNKWRVAGRLTGRLAAKIGSHSKILKAAAIVCILAVVVGAFMSDKRDRYVIHMGDKADMYFLELAPARNPLGMEMKWTVKRNAKVQTKAEAEKTMEQMQKIAKAGGFYAPLKVEHAE